MAELDLKLVNETYQGRVLGQRFEFPANPENKYCLIQFLRGFKKPSGKQGVFSQEQIAQAIPDFDGTTRQRVDDHEQRFRERDGNLLSYLTRQRKVDATVVEAVRCEVLHCPLRETGELVASVNQRLARDDLTAENIGTALESISLKEVRSVLRVQLAQGTIHYKESYLLETMMESLSPEAGELAGLSVPQRSGMSVTTPVGVERLLTPDVPLSEVTVSRFWLVFLRRLFFHGIPLSVLGQWCHVHPTTVLRWILGLALALWPQVNAWIQAQVKTRKADVDEKWIKIRKQGYYWFVVLDVETGLAVYQALLATRSAASVAWLVAE